MTDEIEAALEGAEAEDRVLVGLQYATGNVLNGQPQVIGFTNAVTVSGVMEMRAILERGGLVDPENRVSQVEGIVAGFLIQAGAANVSALLARDIAGLLSEKGLLK